MAINALEIGIEDGLDTTVPDTVRIVSLHGGRIEVVGEETSVAVGREPVVVGRSRRCGIVLRDPAVSKMHCELQATERGVRVVDLGSCNRVYINGAAIVEAYLIDACDLVVCQHRLRFTPEPPHDVVLRAPPYFGGLFGSSSEMMGLIEKVVRYSSSDMSILIHGETGTGKDLLARAIHGASSRRGKPFVPINCAELSGNLLESELFGHERGAFTGALCARDGLFAQADGGTLFLDEVGEMSPAMQGALLRVLESQEVRRIGGSRSRKVDVRVLFATHVDLREAMNTGRFREDLYYRAAQVTVAIPPLRKRLADLPDLVRDILDDLGRKDAFVDDAGMEVLLAQDWRGNVRQLRNVLQRGLVESPGRRLMVERVLDEGSAPVSGVIEIEPYDVVRARLDGAYWKKLFAHCRGNISKMVRLSGKQRGTVKAALKANGLDW